LPSRKPLAMMKYLLLALAVTAISAESLSDSDAPEFSIDEFLDADMSLPCTPKTCVPICRPVTKYLSFGSFKLPYTENVCAPDHKCLAAAAACIKTLQAAMVDAHKKGVALEAASKAKNSAHASKASKDKAAAARKAEAAAAATALGLSKAAFEAAEKEAANAKAAKEAAAKSYAAKAAVMDTRLKSYENAQQSHKNAVAAYDGAKSAAAKAAAAYAAAVKAHCDAEAQHAAAVKNIGHGHLAQKNCEKHAGPLTVKPVSYSIDSVTAAKGVTLWKDRQYAFTTAPSGVLSSSTKYFRPYLESGKQPCPREGGGKLSFSAPATVYMCCANHCGRTNKPTGGGSWKQMGGSYAITRHGGTPCTFYEAKVSAGTHHMCCGGCWASGVFVKNAGE